MQDKPLIERKFPVTESKHFETEDVSDDVLRFLVRVVATPDYYGVEINFSPASKNDYTTTKYYKQSEARSISSQLVENEATKLVSKLGTEQSVELATQLEFAADLAASLSYGDVVGMDDIKKYKRGRITPETLVDEFGEQILLEMDMDSNLL